MACPDCGSTTGVVVESNGAFQQGPRMVFATVHKTKCAACGCEYMTPEQKAANEAAVAAAVRGK